MKKNNTIDFLLNHKKIKKYSSKFSRIHFIIWFFVLFFLYIIIKIFSYTVLNYDFYKALADKQQIWSTIVPVNRWNILSSWEKTKTLATSLNLYDISIDPQMTWDKSKLSDFLIDLVYRELCLNKTMSNCKTNTLRYLRVLDIENFDNSPEFIKKLLSENIISKVSKTKVTSVFFDKELDENQINSIINLWIKWLYPSSNYLYANPEEISDIDYTSSQLSWIIWYEEDTLKHLLRKRDLRYVPIINKSSIHVSEYLKDYIEEEKQAIKRWFLHDEQSIYKFFIFEPRPNRFYPENSLAAQVIGFVDNQWVWHYWIEWYFNDILKWNNWKIISKKDVSWRIIDTISVDQDDLTGEWVSIVTTIDRNIQQKAEQVLEKWVKDFRANKWRIIIMEPNTWRILAMANYPSFDLNNFWDVYELEKVRYSKYPDPSIDLLWYPIFVEDNEIWQKMIYDWKEIFLREATREELWDMVLVKYKYKNDYWAWVYKNDVITSLYEAWSIIKPLTFAIWLDTWEIDINSMYQDNWFLKIDEFTIKNVSDRCLWYNTFQNALNWSCNVWMIRIVQRVWRVLFHQYLEDFWIWFNTWIELSWEASSRLDPWEKWSTAWLLTRSYWLWMMVTQLQVANAYNVIANWWVYLRPRIIDKIVYPDWREEIFKTEPVRRVLKESTAMLMRDVMYDWTHSWRWAAEQWAIDWYRFWLKSWTAQIVYKGKYETWQASTIWSFAWFWPIEDPKFTMVVTLERPRTSVYGWSTAAKVFQEMWEYLVDYMWIPKRDYQFNNFYRNNQ